MLSRKLFAACLTSIIGYFIVPVFFNYASDSYFIIGLAVSTVTVPILFVVGVLSSLAIETFSFSKNIGLSYLKHLVCAILCVLIFTLTTSGLLVTALLVSFVYTTIFFIIDSLSRYFEESKQIEKKNLTGSGWNLPYSTNRSFASRRSKTIFLIELTTQVSSTSKMDFCMSQMEIFLIMELQLVSNVFK